MDWLKGMNDVVSYIEKNLTQPIPYDALSRIVGCSVYEFSRIFSFMSGMYISEYIRRRRLSQAAFDIQNSHEKILDIALKYGYESPTTFNPGVQRATRNNAAVGAKNECHPQNLSAHLLRTHN